VLQRFHIQIADCGLWARTARSVLDVFTALEQVAEVFGLQAQMAGRKLQEVAEAIQMSDWVQLDEGRILVSIR